MISVDSIKRIAIVIRHFTEIHKLFKITTVDNIFQLSMFGQFLIRFVSLGQLLFNAAIIFY